MRRGLERPEAWEATCPKGEKVTPPPPPSWLLLNSAAALGFTGKLEGWKVSVLHLRVYGFCGFGAGV